MNAALFALLWVAQAPDPAAPSPEEVSDPASPVAISTRLHPDTSHIGDLLRLELIVAYPQGFSVNLPIGLSLAPLEVVSVEEGEPESSGSGLRKTFTVTLQHFDVGPAEIPAFPVTYVDLEGHVETVTVPPRRFEVDSLLANEADPQRKPDDPPISLTYPNEAAELAVWVTLGALAVGAGAALAWMRWRRRPRRVVSGPPVPPHVRALADLESLERRRPALIANGAFQDYYLELTEITKAYLEARFSVETLDRTTEEIRGALLRARERVAPLDADAVVRFLQNGDLVKFARFAPPDEDTVAALADARAMVERSVPAADAPAPARQREVA